MIGLDTNIIVRYLAQDDPIQSAVATEIIEGRLTSQNPGFVSLIALIETAWVMQRIYGLSDFALAAVLVRLLQIEVLSIQNEPQVFSAAMSLKDGSGAFADALIAALGDDAGCQYTLTFDRAARSIPGFKLA